MSTPGRYRRPPERWSTALPKGDRLQDALRAARVDPAPPRRLEQVFASVVAIAPGTGGGELAGPAATDTAGGAVAASGAQALTKTVALGKAASASAMTGGGALAKLAVVGLLGAGSVGTAWWIGSDDQLEKPVPIAMPAAPPSGRAAPVDVAPPRAIDRAAAAVPPVASGATTSAATAGSAVSETPVPDERSEAALLGEASGAVSRDPGRAMELVDEAERRFPRGSLGQERELIRVQALVATGRRDEALVRARRLLERDPSSAHRPRLVKVLPELAN